MPKERTEYQNITIEHVDWALRDWLYYDVNPYVRSPNDEQKKVEIMFASGERWAAAHDNRAIRDKNGVLILPLISVRRTSMDRDRTRLALGTEESRFTIARRIDSKTNTVQNAISSRSLPNRNEKGKVAYEVTTIPFPDWFQTSYEIIIWTQYITQMNVIIEKIIDSLDMQNSFVMPVRLSRFSKEVEDDRPFDDRKSLEGYYFVGFMETDLTDAGNFEEFTDQERIIKYTFNIQVPTYLQLDPDGRKPAIQTETTAFDIKFFEEKVTFVDNQLELDVIFSNHGIKIK